MSAPLALRSPALPPLAGLAAQDAQDSWRVPDDPATPVSSFVTYWYTRTGGSVNSWVAMSASDPLRPPTPGESDYDISGYHPDSAPPGSIVTAGDTVGVILVPLERMEEPTPVDGVPNEVFYVSLAIAVVGSVLATALVARLLRRS